MHKHTVVLRVYAHTYNVSPYTRKVKTKCEIFLKNKLSDYFLDFMSFVIMVSPRFFCFFCHAHEISGLLRGRTFLFWCWERPSLACVEVTCFSDEISVCVAIPVSLVWFCSSSFSSHYLLYWPTCISRGFVHPHGYKPGV